MAHVIKATSSPEEKNFSKIQNGQNFLQIFTKLLIAPVQKTVNRKYQICVRKSFTSLSHFDNHLQNHICNICNTHNRHFSAPTNLFSCTF